MRNYVSIESLLIDLVEPYAAGVVEDAADAARSETVQKRMQEFRVAVLEVPRAGERLLADFTAAFGQRRGWRREGLTHPKAA